METMTSVLDLSFFGFSQLFIDFISGFNKQVQDKFIKDVISVKNIKNIKERNKTLAENYAYNIRTNPINNMMIAGSLIIENIRNKIELNTTKLNNQ